MPRVCCHDGIAHSQKALRYDRSDFEAVEVLRSYFFQDPPQCALDFLRAKSTEEHPIHFTRHEKEVPARGMDPTIEDEAIQHLDQTPTSRAGFTFQPQGLHGYRPLLHENRSNLYGCRHESSYKLLLLRIFFWGP